jgi:hypothetical protein
MLESRRVDAFSHGDKQNAVQQAVDERPEADRRAA